ncbi:MAG TPA: FAD-dependent monooxygenase [Kofleriaceae bacterium]|jgi:2-polyprenyl-6-methoxyphenol hydroxylase-like FAD-dependent oxidoreductase
MDYDVIIAGAGPVGLFLACELRLRDISVLVLEQQANPTTPLKQLPFGLRGLWGPSVEAFYRRGLLDEIMAGPKMTSGPVKNRAPGSSGPAGHFGGIQFDYANVDQARWTYRLPGPSDKQTGASMEHIESVLAARALALGVEVHRGEGVDSITEVADGVRVGRYTARYVVGCDGGRSTVRKLSGFDFVGTDPEFTGYSLLVDIEQNPLPMGRHSTPHGSFTQWQSGAIGLCDFDGGAMHRQTITQDHAQAVIRKITGVDVRVAALHLASTWTDRSMQATTYQRGRVLLAGDAAHVHSPLGGQGLNLGLGDAMNLGWKLAATIRGKATTQDLLATYTAERHPVGARILEWTRAQVALMKPGSHALANVMRDIMATRDGATYFAERVWSVTTRYDVGEEHPLAGRSCPDFELADGTRLGEHLRDGNGVLLDFTGALASLEDEQLEGEKRTSLTRVKHIELDAQDRLGLTAVLVRPDGFVAWASDSTPNGDEVSRALARWF